ncbi:MAG: septum formation protein Maf [Pseudomonadota bacterium]|jgi:septum formation protein
MASVKKLILASQSPFRRALLSSAGLEFESAVAPIDEYTITADLPGVQASRRAEAKALAVAALHPDALVIGADQVLSFEDLTFDKARDVATARERLQALAGRTHFLHSAFALAYGNRGDAPVVTHSERVDVGMTMRPLSDYEIEAYLATGEWRGSVGCYQYENRGVHLFSSVSGDHSSIIGLPLLALLEKLREAGINALLQPSPPWHLRA